MELEDSLTKKARINQLDWNIPEYIVGKIAIVKAKKKPILLEPMDKETMLQVKLALFERSDISYITLDVDGTPQLLIKYQDAYQKLDVKESMLEQRKLYDGKKFKESIEVGFYILRYLKYPNAQVYALLGATYLSLRQTKNAAMYFKVATYLHNSPYEYKAKIADLERESLELCDDKKYIPFFEREFTNVYNNGTLDIDSILIMILEENVSVEEACSFYNLAFNDVLKVKIFLAREYYAEGLDFLAEKLLNEVAKMQNKSRDIRVLLNETMRNKKLYSNKGSMRMRLKEN